MKINNVWYKGEEKQIIHEDLGAHTHMHIGRYIYVWLFVKYWMQWHHGITGMLLKQKHKEHVRENRQTC